VVNLATITGEMAGGLFGVAGNGARVELNNCVNRGKVEATKNGIQWTEATEEEQLNFNGEVTAEEVRKHHRDSYDFAKKLKFY
jgi:hypothetical protein